MEGYEDGPSSQAKFNYPLGIELDESKQILYVADTSSHLVRKIDLATRQVSTLGQNYNSGSYIDGSLSIARFSRPSGLALDVKNQKLYVTEELNHSIRCIDLIKEEVTSVIGHPSSSN